MSNLFDFLEWRGDLTFEQDPFHDLDALVMTQISYFTFENMMEENDHLTLKEAWEKMKDEKVSSRFVQKSDQKFFEMLSESVRYKDLEIGHFSHKLEEEQKIQFAAVTILLPDGTPFLAFRGTDMSLVGWKEDLYMAFSEYVPAQVMAVEYLKKIVDIYQKPVYMGGHSKGGNLALYAATVAPEEIQDQIKMVYMHDSPGLTEKLFESEGYTKIKERLQVILPEQSIVGILMNHPEKYSVVKSTAGSGVLQHNPYTWQVMGKHYVLAEGRKKESHYVEVVTKKWVEENEEEELRDFVESMFDVLKTSEAESVDELLKNVKKNPKLLLQVFRSADDESHKAFKQTMSQMAETALHEATSELKEATSEMKERGIDLTKKNAKKLMELLPGKSRDEENIIDITTESMTEVIDEPAGRESSSDIEKSTVDVGTLLGSIRTIFEKEKKENKNHGNESNVIDEDERNAGRLQ